MLDPAATLAVKAEYDYVEYGTMYKALIVENISTQNVTVPGTLVLRDENGVAIGCSFDTIDVLGPGETSILHCGTTPVDGGPAVATSSYMLKPYVTDYYLPVLAGLTATSAPADNNKVSVSVTNSGTLAAKYVQAYVIFFDAEGKVLDVEYKYIGDSDSEIKPGATETGEVWGPSSGYDHTEVYLVGEGKS